LTRAVNKVEAFVEEWEANEALGGAFTGGLPLTQASGETPATGESRTLGLTPTAKSSSKARHQPPGGSPEKERRTKVKRLAPRGLALTNRRHPGQGARRARETDPDAEGIEEGVQNAVETGDAGRSRGSQRKLQRQGVLKKKRPRRR
jgi:hypothetical protein